MKQWSVAVSRLLREHRLTQRELAAAVGLSQSQMSRLLNGKGYPSLQSLESIASHFNVPMVELFATEPEAAAIRAHSPQAEARRQFLLDQIAELAEKAKNVGDAPDATRLAAAR